MKSHSKTTKTKLRKTSGKHILRVSNIHKSFGGIRALQGTTLAVEENTITALIGPNGCGKSTLFNVINKINVQDTGTIKLNDKDYSRVKAYQIAKRGVARTFQYPTLFKHLTIQDHIEMALLRDDESIIKSLFRPRKNNAKKVKEILDRVGLQKPLSTKGSDLSYGQRKLLDLAMALAQPHDIILLDEPVAGINPKLRKEMKAILKKLRDEGETLLVIEHDMNFVMDLADHVYVMHEGKVLTQGKPKEIQNNKQVLEVYLGD